MARGNANGRATGGDQGSNGGTVGPQPIMYCGFYPRKRRVISFQAKEGHEVIS